MKHKHAHSVSVEAVCIQGWCALVVRDHSRSCRGVDLPREEVPWFLGKMGPLLGPSTEPIPSHIARAWGPLRVLVSPRGVRLWRSPGSWPIEGVAITAAEARHVIEAVARCWS